MKIAVMGAGAVGCYYGAMLARAGHEVTLIGRPQHVDAVEANGLYLDAVRFQEHVRMRATTGPDGVAGADIVLFCVKSADTESAGEEIGPCLKAEAAVLSLQNGVDNAERLAAVLDRAVIPAVVYVATEMKGPGHVKHHGRGELALGPSPKSSAIAETFTAAAIPTVVSDNAITDLWEKLILNSAYNALSAIPQLPYGRFTKVDGVAEIIRDVVTECVAVAKASGVTISANIMDKVFGLPGSMPNQYSSTAQDLARGKATEIDYLNGYIVRKGTALGVPTPANRVLHVLVKLMEAKG